MCAVNYDNKRSRYYHLGQEAQTLLDSVLAMCYTVCAVWGGAHE